MVWIGERKAIVSLERRQLFKNVYFSFCGIVSEERRRLFVERGRRLFEIRKCGGWQAWARWKGSALPEWRPVTTNGHSICSMPVQPALSTTTLLRTTTAADGKLLQRRFSEIFFLFDLLLRVLKGRCHLRFSGICPLRGYPPPLNGKSVWKKEGFFP